jgi:hypothetical protein
VSRNADPRIKCGLELEQKQASMNCLTILTIEDVLLGCDLFEMAMELLLTGLTGARLLLGRRGPRRCDQGVISRLRTGLCHHRGAHTQLFQRLPAKLKEFANLCSPISHKRTCCVQSTHHTGCKLCRLFYLQFVQRGRQ